jgi:predicted DNA-binding transcriptional regulator AlpA
VTIPPSNKSPAERVEPLAVGLNDLPAMLGLSRRTIERERSAGKFPKADRVVGKRPIWSIATIRRWLEGGGA